MDIRKIAVLGSFAAGAALALAPLASADPAAVDPTLVSSTLDSEVATLNTLFISDATLAGDGSFITYPSVPGEFSVVIPNDVSTVQDNGTTPFDYLIYGVDPSKAGLASDPGSFNDFNGALTQFDNAFNVELYSLANGGVLDTNVADYIQNGALDHALTLANTTDAFEYLLNFGLGDLQGFLGIF